MEKCSKFTQSFANFFLDTVQDMNYIEFNKFISEDRLKRYFLTLCFICYLLGEASRDPEPTIIFIIVWQKCHSERSEESISPPGDSSTSSEWHPPLKFAKLQYVYLRSFGTGSCWIGVYIWCGIGTMNDDRWMSNIPFPRSFGAHRSTFIIYSSFGWGTRCETIVLRQAQQQLLSFFHFLKIYPAMFY